MVWLARHYYTDLAPVSSAYAHVTCSDKMATGIQRAASKQKSITAESAPTGPIAVIKEVGTFLYRNEFAR